MVKNNDDIVKYIQNQIAQSNARALSYILDEKGEKNPKRDLYPKINKHIKSFLKGSQEPRWITIPGIRGVGKTTLLAQLFDAQKIPQKNKLFLSIDQTIQYLGIPLDKVLEAYEDILGVVFEKLDEPVILFLDEIQYEKDWGIILKTIYDRSKKVFVVSTGSSAISLQTNTDIARRTVLKKLYPMSFAEYLRIKEKREGVKGLSEKIKKSLFESSSAKEVFSSLEKLKPEINDFWTGIDRQEMDKYIKYGSLPFTLGLKDEALIYEQIKKLLEKVVNNDIAKMKNFTPKTISKIPSLLYLIANSDELSLRNVSKTLSLSITTVDEILEALIQAEVIYKIPSYGTAYKQTRKPAKYMFSTPAFRAMYFNFSSKIDQGDKGKLLEDLTSLYLVSFLDEKVNTSLTYDGSKVGSDFILQFGGQKIAVEVGYGEKDFKQVSKTLDRVKAKYGLNISKASLSLSKEENSVNIPLETFLLL